MKDMKAICKKLLSPPVWLMLLLTVISTVSLIGVFLKGWDATPIAYVVYILSFYTLSVITILCIKVFPGCYRKIKQNIYKNKIGNRYMTDAAFRIHISLYLSLGVNLLYVATNLFSGFWYGSAWFAILAAYYTILAVMRFLLLRYVNKTGIGKDRIKELRRSRLCGIILITINLVLSGSVLMMLYQNRGYEYHGVLIYVMALYTFYVTIQSIVNIFKYRKYNSPVMQTTKEINFAAALVSMLSLETAMLSQFGSAESPEFRRIMIASTGAGVSIIIITMSIYMIIRTNKEIKLLRTQNDMFPDI